MIKAIGFVVIAVLIAAVFLLWVAGALIGTSELRNRDQ
jgi:hypothetical protein